MSDELQQIKHKITGEVLFELKIGGFSLAIKAAVKEKKSLEGADLRGAYLRGAYLRGAYLRGAYLRGAYLEGADLRGADLRGADLEGADLRGAYLRGADLEGADLRGAYLRGAYLEGAYLEGADLRGADLRGADLEGADLRGADLRGAKDIIRVEGVIPYAIYLTPKHVKAGCQFHTWEEWRGFDKAKFEEFERGASEYRDYLYQVMDLFKDKLGAEK